MAPLDGVRNLANHFHLSFDFNMIEFQQVEDVLLHEINI